MTIQDGYSAPTGSSANIGWRVWKLIPGRWFQWVAPYRDAIIGGLSDSAAWNYTLIGYARAQTRLATAYGVWLDILCYDFLGSALTRAGLQDDNFRAVIKATVLQERVTRAGMINAISRLTGLTPWVFEPWNTGDTGAYSNGARGQICGQFGYGVGQGGYGSMKLPAQTLLKIQRTTPSGVPGVDGYDGAIGGYGTGAIEYVGNLTQLEGITDQVIYNLINMTKPTGSICWVAFQTPAQIITNDAGTILTDDNSVTLVTR